MSNIVKLYITGFCVYYLPIKTKYIVGNFFTMNIICFYWLCYKIKNVQMDAFYNFYFIFVNPVGEIFSFEESNHKLLASLFFLASYAMRESIIVWSKSKITPIVFFLS